MGTYLIPVIMHFIGDFYLQTSKVARCKNANIGKDCNSCSSCKKNAFINIKYIAIHTLLYVVPFLFVFLVTKWVNALLAIIAVCLSHCIVDTITCFLNKKTKHTLVFALDQALHIVIILGLFKLFEVDTGVSEYEFVFKTILIILILLAPSSVFINKLFYDLFPESGQGKIFDVGSIIGMFERVLTLIFAYFGNFAAIAIIITVKTWARANDLKEPGFRNKYLLGTLASLVLALVTFLLYKI